MDQKKWIKGTRLKTVTSDDERYTRVQGFELTTNDLDKLEESPKSRKAFRELLPKDAALRDWGEFGVLLRTGPEDWILPVCSKIFDQLPENGKLPTPRPLDLT